MNITKDTVATLSYTVTETNGQVVGRTQPDEPVTALIGHGFLIKGLEKAPEGHKKGDEFAIQLEPKDSYGEYDKNLVQTIDRAMFGDFEIAVGNVFEADSEHGPMAVVIKEINDKTVVVDGNHPLAGKILNFLIVVEDVREATPEEIKHGHAHVGGHCPSEDHDTSTAAVTITMMRMSTIMSITAVMAITMTTIMSTIAVTVITMMMSMSKVNITAVTNTLTSN